MYKKENISKVKIENQETNITFDKIIKLNKNILIYPHLPFSLSDGGTNVQYYLAYILSTFNLNVKIYNVHDNNKSNQTFNNFVSDINSVDFDNTIVIYCEGIKGNPLNAKYVVRWMLSKLGQNVPFDYYYTWNPNELVYFFNNEINMINENINFKVLSLFYINPKIQNNKNNNRKGLCYTIRKNKFFYQNIDINSINNKIYNAKNFNPFEITYAHNQDNYIYTFNKHEYFISYDPLTFLNIIAILCGCVSIVYPVEGVSKLEYFKMTPFYQYMVEKKCFEIYGLAYGISKEEITYAKNTLHLAKQQMKDVQNWLVDKYVKQFIIDINEWDKNKNVLEYYKKSMLENNYQIDTTLYKYLHNDLSHMSHSDLIQHYKIYGKNEGRLANINSFYDFYPDFNINVYKYIHDDLKNLSDNEAKMHYYMYGKNEGRNINMNFLYVLYPDFDINFYKSVHDDLINMSETEAKMHYYMYGKNEGRIINEKYIPNENLENMNHFYKNLLLINEKYNEYDFVVNDDYSLQTVDDKIDNLINDHHYFRSINTYEKLVEHLKKHEKKYYVYNKENFYKYYYDFDYEYYKNNYFKNNDTMSEKDILFYYHFKGKYENHTTNNKINIVIYTPPYNEKCGGIIVMHYFCKLINEKYNDRFSAKLFMHNNLKYKNPFCNNFARLDEINDNTIVIYPEIVIGNPLNAKNVVRWVLLELGIEMPLDHYKNWSTSDLIYHWEPIDKQLSCPFYNNIFTNKNLEKRDKTCYLVKKGKLIHKNINYIHPPDSIFIDDLSLEEKSNIFNECKFFYTYDPNTAYIIFSAACGCIPIIYPTENVSEEDYFKSNMFNFDNNIYNKGIVYGNNIEKINFILENKLNENNEIYYRNLFTIIEQKTFLPFLEDIKNLIL